MAEGGGRVPPQNVDAEESVLGAILLDNQAIDRVTGVLQPDDFYRESHRKIYRAMQATAAQLQAGNRDFRALSDHGTQVLRTAGFRPDYYEILATNLSPPGPGESVVVILVAAWLGKARLLDNLRVSL